MKKIAALLLTALMAVGTIAGTVSVHAEAPYSPSEETLVVANKGNPTSLFHLNVSAVSVNTPFSETLYDRLTSYDGTTNSVGPMLATEWEYIDDTHVRFKLRDDVVSHAGDPFTANDVIYSIKTAIDSGALGNYFGMFNLDECQVEDDYTVVLATNHVEPYFLYTLANVPLGMVVQASVENNGGLEAQGLNPTAGTGPYKFVEWSDGSYIKLERNDNYWGNTPYYKNVEIRIIGDASARIMNLESHDINIALDPDNIQLAGLEGNPDYTIINYPTSNSTNILFNCSKAPFNDEHVRRAVALALNYEANLMIAASGYGSLSDSFLPLASSGYVSAADGGYESYFHYDLEAAKAELAQSAYPDGFEFQMLYAEAPTFNTYAEMIQNQLSELGIKTTLVPVASTVFYDYVAAGDFDAHIVNKANPDPNMILRDVDGRIDFKTARGGCGWVDAPQEVLDLIDEAKVTLDPEKSKEVYGKLQALINAACPVIPLYSPNKVCAVDSNIQGIGLTEFSDIDFSKAYKAE